ncbi:hypothetical protein BH11ARM2_BH11ARM2_01990 [soil metagenome]
MIALAPFLLGRLPAHAGNLPEFLPVLLVISLLMTPVWSLVLNLSMVRAVYSARHQAASFYPLVLSFVSSIPYFVGRSGSNNEEELFPILASLSVCCLSGLIALMWGWANWKAVKIRDQ